VNVSGSSLGCGNLLERTEGQKGLRAELGLM